MDSCLFLVNEQNNVADPHPLSHSKLCDLLLLKSWITNPARFIQIIDVESKSNRLVKFVSALVNNDFIFLFIAKHHSCLEFAC